MEAAWVVCRHGGRPLLLCLREEGWKDGTYPSSYTRIHRYYYPPEVRRGEYWGLGVFLLQYFPGLLSRYEIYCIIIA